MLSTCATDAPVSLVSVLVIDCIAIGSLPPMTTSPTFTFEAGRLE